MTAQPSPERLDAVERAHIRRVLEEGEHPRTDAEPIGRLVQREHGRPTGLVIVDEAETPPGWKRIIREVPDALPVNDQI